ncbi:hypothetical protein ACFL6G_09555 [candidate division KSB1 bacterium]
MMGQQQLLLIVLGVIIVGISVAVGINMMTAGAADANFDNVMADLQTMAADAQGWFRKPTSLGGGGRSFELLTTAGGLALLGYQVEEDGSYVNANGTYTISTAGDADDVTFQGVGFEDGDGDDTMVTITMQVEAGAMTPTITSR